MKWLSRGKGGPRAESQSEWHRWFAWYPVLVTTKGKRTRFWLRHVARKLNTSRSTGERKWRYRAR